MNKLLIAVAAIAVFTTPVFAGSGPGGVHSTDSSNLQGFNARQNAKSEAAVPNDQMKNSLYEIQGMQPAAGDDLTDEDAAEAGQYDPDANEGGEEENVQQ